MDVHEQVVEIHSISLTAPFAVSCVNILYGRHLMLHVCGDGILGVGVFGCGDEVVFCHADTVGYGSRLIYLVIEFHLLDDSLYK